MCVHASARFPTDPTLPITLESAKTFTDCELFLSARAQWWIAETRSFRDAREVTLPSTPPPAGEFTVKYWCNLLFDKILIIVRHMAADDHLMTMFSRAFTKQQKKPINYEARWNGCWESTRFNEIGKYLLYQEAPSTVGNGNGGSELIKRLNKN